MMRLGHWVDSLCYALRPHVALSGGYILAQARPTLVRTTCPLFCSPAKCILLYDFGTNLASTFVISLSCPIPAQKLPQQCIGLTLFVMLCTLLWLYLVDIYWLRLGQLLSEQLALFSSLQLHRSSSPIWHQPCLQFCHFPVFSYPCS